MHFASDNSGPVHPKVMAAMTSANQGYAMAYGADRLMDRVRDQIREVFEAPDAAVYLTATGTAANSLIIATLAQPWQTVFCSQNAHIHEDECNAPEFFSGGAKLTLVPGTDAKFTPQSLHRAIEKEENRGVHGPQRGPVSITQVTELGTLYSLGEIKALTAVAEHYDLPVHMDGARFANAIAALGCSPAEMSWRAGIDALSFGGTKNGLMGVEAVIFFDPRHAWEFELRRKRAAHLFSKHRFLSAQFSAYLENDLWLEMAQAANRQNQRLKAGLQNLDGVTFEHEPGANMLFARFERQTHQRLQSAGAVYHMWDGQLDGADPRERLAARLVCDWSLSDQTVDEFVSLVAG